MALLIKRDQNLFKVIGELNVATARNFKTHFVIALNSLDELIIDLTGVTQVDEAGLTVLKLIHEYSISWNKGFSIIGNPYGDSQYSYVA